jgi:predicted site-specific integrase-resolvase
MPFENLMDAHHLAKRLHVTGRTILNWARRGWIPCLRAGRKSVYFDPEEVEKALQAQGGWIGRVESEVKPAVTVENQADCGKAS